MPVDADLLGIISEAMENEMVRASEKFGKFHNAHEGFAVLKEEVDELWDAVKLNQKRPERNKKLLEECIQVGAMAMRFIYDLELEYEEVEE